MLPLAYMTSYNEHYEGSGVEPTEDAGRPDYLGIIRDVFLASGAPVLAHYVTWHSSGASNWLDAPALPLRRDTPAGGYGSLNPSIIAQHNAEMEANGILPMTSWWGPDAYSGDKFLDVYLPISGPHTALLYEAVGPGRLSDGPAIPVDFTIPDVADQFVREMEHLRNKYFNGAHGQRFLRIDGRPVVFIWVSHAFRGPFESVAARVREFVYLVGSEFTVPAVITTDHEQVLRGLDAVTSYGFYDTGRYAFDMDDRFLSEYTTALRKWQGLLGKVSPKLKLIPPMTFSYDERKIPGRQGYAFRSSQEIADRYARIVRSFVAGPTG
jgi:hypothetical protein